HHRHRANDRRRNERAVYSERTGARILRFVGVVRESRDGPFPLLGAAVLAPSALIEKTHARTASSRADDLFRSFERLAIGHVLLTHRARPFRRPSDVGYKRVRQSVISEDDHLQL